MKTQLTALLLTLISTSAFAITDDYNKTVDRLGTQGASTGAAYFSVKEGLSLDCPYGVVYVDITTYFGRTAFASLLAAKSSGRPLSWIQYPPTGVGGVCMLAVVEVKD